MLGGNTLPLSENDEKQLSHAYMDHTANQRTWLEIAPYSLHYFDPDQMLPTVDFLFGRLERTGGTVLEKKI